MPEVVGVETRCDAAADCGIIKHPVNLSLHDLPALEDRPAASWAKNRPMADETLLYLLDDVRGKTLKVLQNLDETHARWAPPNLQNSCLWHAGHAFVVTEFLTMRGLGKEPQVPEGWFKMFSWESNPAHTSPESWPPLAEVVAALTAQHKRLRDVISGLSDSQLEAPDPGNTGHTVRYSIMHGIQDEAAPQRRDLPASQADELHLRGEVTNCDLIRDASILLHLCRLGPEWSPVGALTFLLDRRLFPNKPVLPSARCLASQSGCPLELRALPPNEPVSSTRRGLPDLAESGAELMRSPNPAMLSRSLALAFACAFTFALLVLGQSTARADEPEASAPKIDYSRDIRPLLSDACFACHGPDEHTRAADLRLDLKEGAFGDRGGYAAIVPEDAESSELFYRISSDDDLDRMPPADSNKELTPEQVELIRTWIEQGATWEEHWAFIPPSKPEPPEVDDPSWTKNPIDQFILDRLEREGLEPAPDAETETLVRRVYLDLTGLPPTLEEIDAFLNDDRADRFEQLVDQLLDSPRFGEHLARFWLDAARYGDTHGLHLDNYREMWPYRDWVVSAFNKNLPYDQFIIDQLAGDLLPDPTLDQLIATGFNRAHVTTSEGGSIEEEVYVRNVIERVDATGSVFLGLTVGCARCHDHKFDPISQSDYYSMFAFFNSIDGKPLDGNAKAHAPIVQVPSEEQKAERERLDASLAAIKTKIADAVASIDYDPAQDKDQGEYVQRSDFVWVDDAIPTGGMPSGEGDWSFVAEPEHPVFRGAKSHVRTSEGQSQHYFTEATQGLLVGEGDTLFTYVFLDPLNPPKEIMLQWNTGEWKHRAFWGENLIEYGANDTTERVSRGPLPTSGEWVRLDVPASDVGIAPGTTISGMAFTQHGGTVRWDAAGIRSWTPQPGKSYTSLASWIRDQKILGDKAGLPESLRAIVSAPMADRTEEQNAQLLAYFVEHAYEPARSVLEPLIAERTTTEAARKTLEDSIPTTLVWKELAEPKPAFILNRGEYDQHGEQVSRSVPSFLPPFPEGTSLDRLGLASLDGGSLESADRPGFGESVLAAGVWHRTGEDVGRLRISGRATDPPGTARLARGPVPG